MSVLQLSVVVPCLNEEENLVQALARIEAAAKGVVGDSYEIIFINDGSTDSSWEIMRRFALEDPHRIAVNLSRNYGHQLALSAGLNLCQGGRVLVLDADMQDPPELLDAMMKRMDEGADVVYGQRSRRSGETAFKTKTAAWFYKILGLLSEVDIPCDTGDFRLINRRVLDVLNKMPEKDRFVRGMVSWIGFRQVALSYERDARKAGRTNYPLAKMVRFALDAITGFSVRPLRLASYLGTAFGVVGLLLLFYVFASWITGETVQGWTSLAAIVLVLGSCQLFVLGVMGEYLGRLYREAKNRPLYIIQEVVGKARE